MKVFVTHEANMPPSAIAAALEGLQEMCRFLPLTVEVTNYGPWRAPDWRNARGQLMPYQSMDWFIADAMRPNGQVNASAMLTRLAEEPYRRQVPHVDVVLLHTDLTAPGCNFVFGAARPGIGCVLSLARYAPIRPIPARDACFQTVLMHEVGHVFGLVPRTRTHAAEENLGWHCTNHPCLMRQGLTVAASELLTMDRLNYPAQVLCGDCRENLRQLWCEAV